jgi:DNA-binding transcriptional LysR family regulator
MRGLNLDHLRAFAEVIELGSFSAAAERLRITQPAISLRVRALEKRFGMRLVERIGKRATPTAAGTELLCHAHRLEMAAADAFAAMAPYANGSARSVRIGAGATPAAYLLPQVLAQLRERNPGLNIRVITGYAEDILRSIKDNEIDIGVVTMPAAGRVFDVTPILEDELLLVAPETLTLPATMAPAAIADLPLVLYGARTNTRNVIDSWFARDGITVRPMIELGSGEAIKEVVGRGVGCSILPAMALRKVRADMRLVTSSLSPKLHRVLAVVVRRDRPLHKVLRDTIKALHGADQPATVPS